MGYLPALATKKAQDTLARFTSQWGKNGHLLFLVILYAKNVHKQPKERIKEGYQGLGQIFPQKKAPTEAEAFLKGQKNALLRIRN